MEIFGPRHPNIAIGLHKYKKNYFLLAINKKFKYKYKFNSFFFLYKNQIV